MKRLAALCLAAREHRLIQWWDLGVDRFILGRRGCSWQGLKSVSRRGSRIFGAHALKTSPRSRSYLGIANLKNRWVDRAVRRSWRGAIDRKSAQVGPAPARDTGIGRLRRVAATKRRPTPFGIGPSARIRPEWKAIQPPAPAGWTRHRSWGCFAHWGSAPAAVPVEKTRPRTQSTRATALAHAAPKIGPPFRWRWERTALLRPRVSTHR